MKTPLRRIGCQYFAFLGVLLTIVFFAQSCQPRKTKRIDQTTYEVSAEERLWMTKLFDNILFWEHGIYTLWGSKPITEIVLSHYTNDELAQIEKTASLNPSNNGYLVEGDLEENWGKWEAVQSRFPMKRYLLFKSHDSVDGRHSFVYFVNILKTATVIQENYDLFSKAVGFDFHPLEVVLEMPNHESMFWNRLNNSCDSPMLWGILFGFGRQNSHCFYWKHFDCPKIGERFFDQFPGQFSNPEPTGMIRISAQNFTLPTFVSFSDEDEVLERYKIERKKILQIYLKGDRLDITLQKLTN